MAWDDTIANAIARNTTALNRLAKALETMSAQWEPVIQGLLEEQREEAAERSQAQRRGARSRRPHA